MNGRTKSTASLDRLRQNREMARAYREGLSLHEVGDRFGRLTFVGAWYALRAQGVEMRPVGQIRKPIFSLVLMRCEGLPYREIGARIGVVGQVVRERLRRAGIDDRAIAQVRRLSDAERELYRIVIDEDRLSHSDAMDLVLDARRAA